MATEHKPVAFIRKKDGEIFEPHPTENHLLLKSMYDKFGDRSPGHKHWTIESFLNMPNDFEPVWSKWDIKVYSDYYRLQNELKEATIKYNEHKTGICSGCQMALHVCLCSHDD